MIVYILLWVFSGVLINYIGLTIQSKSFGEDYSFFLELKDKKMGPPMLATYFICMVLGPISILPISLGVALYRE